MHLPLELPPQPMCKASLRHHTCEHGEHQVTLDVPSLNVPCSQDTHCAGHPLETLHPGGQELNFWHLAFPPVKHPHSPGQLLPMLAHLSQPQLLHEARQNGAVPLQYRSPQVGVQESSLRALTFCEKTESAIKKSNIATCLAFIALSV